MDLRQAKALEIAARLRLTLDGGGWLVPSQSGSGTYRVVTWPGAGSCTCPDYELTLRPCKHILAARLVEEREDGNQAPPLNTDAVPKKPTYRQNWPAYNEAQMTEKRRLLALLHDLCRGVDEPPQPRTGRRRTVMADMAFARGLNV